MNDKTLLLRQVHPTFFRDGLLTSQAFMPFPKDNGQLSVYDGDQATPEQSFVHYTVDFGFLSAGVWAVTSGECGNIGLSSHPDPIEGSPAHAYIDFGSRAEKDCRKLAKRLKELALSRDRLHPL